MALSKAQEWEAIRQINLAYLRMEPGMAHLVDLLHSRRQSCLEALVKANPQTIFPIQGECNALSELLQDITVQKPDITPQKK